MSKIFKMLFLLILVSGTGESKEAQPTTQAGSESYRSGQNLREWRIQARQTLIKTLGLNGDMLVKPALRNREIFLGTVNVSKISRLNKDLAAVEMIPQASTTKESLCQQSLPKVRVEKSQRVNSNAKTVKNVSDTRVRFLQKIDYIEAFTCEPGAAGVRIYELNYKSFDQELISSYLFVPQMTVPSDSKIPTLVYFHGHLSSKEDAAFSKSNYLKGLAYKAALNGFVVLVPGIRGFVESEVKPNKTHLAKHHKLKSEGKSLIAAEVMDAIYGQDVLESLKLSDHGLTGGQIDTKRNAIAGVSLGGQIALFTAALDGRFEFAGVNSIFIGFEELFADNHCPCSIVPGLAGQFNAPDLALLVLPRRLHIGFARNDPLYGESFLSATKSLVQKASENGISVCNRHGVAQFLPSSVTTGEACSLVVEEDVDEGHAAIGLSMEPGLYF